MYMRQAGCAYKHVNYNDRLIIVFQEFKIIVVKHSYDK